MWRWLSPTTASTSATPDVRIGFHLLQNAKFLSNDSFVVFRRDILKMAYQYKPLSNLEGEIRVAILQPGAYNDEICASFSIQHLQAKKKSRSSVSTKSVPYVNVRLDYVLAEQMARI